MPKGVYPRKSDGRQGQYVRTPEIRHKNAKASFGKKASLETREKMSATRKGRPSWNSGKGRPYYLRFHQQRKAAKQHGIEFLLTYDQWLSIWKGSGHLPERGRRRGNYVMSRPGDVGPYSVENVRIVTVLENVHDYLKGKKKRVHSSKEAS